MPGWDWTSWRYVRKNAPSSLTALASLSTPLAPSSRLVRIFDSISVTLPSRAAASMWRVPFMSGHLPVASGLLTRAPSISIAPISTSTLSSRLSCAPVRSRYEITSASLSISLRLLMPFRNVSAQLIL